MEYNRNIEDAKEWEDKLLNLPTIGFLKGEIKFEIEPNLEYNPNKENFLVTTVIKKKENKPKEIDIKIKKNKKCKSNQIM